MVIRLVTFDALHTLLAPRLPIYVQYSQTFQPYLGTLNPDTLKRSFKTALKQLQAEKPVYQTGVREWGARWSGGPRWVRAGSCGCGQLFDDTLPTLQSLKQCNIHTGVISNTDTRMRAVLKDLEILPYLEPTLFSEEEGVEKPSREIFLRACSRVGVRPQEAVHVGDELQGDFYGAKESGLAALLIRRPGPEGEGEAKEADEDLSGVDVVPSLLDVVEKVKQMNSL
ncbi:Haloacid dehalogenase-like hydrolase domain-containing protein 3 [Grifola frondosa]|uniref:Haloacid dehalogenase-like hydrolase domain-containing protein 3 n=1 Tax=Grifola frondosa TaxID=5627 RepID=A0A1C7LSZ2_GRIFR|nr:Haloacid dehalogenase-like hydrolase domain-containing protein 3 [Grifola frondosa]